MYRVFKIDGFAKLARKLFDAKELLEIEVLIQDLKEGKLPGKPLTYDFLREKKVGGKRVYYLFYEEFSVVFLVGASGKKHQQTSINKIKKLLPHFKEMARRLSSIQ